MRLSIWKCSYLFWSIPAVILGSLGMIVLNFFTITFISLAVFLLLVVLSSVFLVGFILDFVKHKNFLNRIITTIDKFVFYYEVKNPLLLIVWVKTHEEWFRTMVDELVSCLKEKGVQVDLSKMNREVFVKFKDVGKVGYLNKSGTWVKCSGFQKKGYIEIEWSLDYPSDRIKRILRHEVAHFLIDQAMPNLSERAHHKIMNFEG